jgi:hypothetical protein
METLTANCKHYKDLHTQHQQYRDLQIHADAPVHKYHPMKTHKGHKGKIKFIRILGTREMGVSFILWSLSPCEKSSLYPHDGKPSRHQSFSGCDDEEKTVCP